MDDAIVQNPDDETDLFSSHSIPAYSTNSLTTVAVGKSSLDSHSHFRQPGMELGTDRTFT